MTQSILKLVEIMIVLERMFVEMSVVGNVRVMPVMFNRTNMFVNEPIRTRCGEYSQSVIGRENPRLCDALIAACTCPYI